MTHKTWRVVALAALLACSAAACGNRLSTEEILAQNTVKADVSSGGIAAGSAADGNPASVTGSDGAVHAGSGQDPVLSGGADGGATGAAAGSGDAGAGAPAAGGPAGGAQAAGGPKAPIVLGYLAWLSGLGGETMAPSRDALVAWSKAVNAKGGINGHQVQLLVGDHGGNESRALSIARDFVENKGAIALMTQANGSALADYAKSKSVPVVGGVLTGGVWNSNPMLFPPFGAELNTAWGAATLIKRNGMTKVASAFCAESGDCEAGAGRFERAAKEVGIELVSQQRYSETQPDFTAVCLQMQRSGAQAVYPTGSTAAMIRMARSCSQQGFNPVWISPTMDDSVASISQFENAIAVNPVFPWFLRGGNPGVDEYAAAMAKYAPSRITNGNTFQAWAWASAKLFEKAAQNVSDKPSSQQILDALWAMKGETLGGLVPPRTFTRNQPTPETYCVYEGRIQGGKWVAPKGLEPTCK